MKGTRKAISLALGVGVIVLLLPAVAGAYGMGMMNPGWGQATVSSTQSPGYGWCWDPTNSRWLPPTTTTSAGTPTTTPVVPPSPGVGWCWDAAGWRWTPPTTGTPIPSPTSGSPTTGAPISPTASWFRDVPAGCWYGGAVSDLAQRGIVGGYDDGTFRADLTITRGQFASMLGRMLGVQAGGSASFPDVRGTSVEGYVAALAQRGVMQGYADGSFGPNDRITRAQAAAFVGRAFGLPNTWTETVQFSDLTGQWACGYIHQLWRQGVISGYGNGTYGPNDPITRAQAAAMLWRCGSLR
jgi:S-layer homology domain